MKPFTFGCTFEQARASEDPSFCQLEFLILLAQHPHPSRMSPHPPDVESASPMARTAYNALVLILVAILAVVIWRIVTFDPVEQGMSENRNAWEASFTERGLPVEQNGPRDGYWSSRISTPVNHPLVGWHSSEVSLESMLDIDEHGYQYYISPDPSTVRILILGGSVAFGSYSSSEATSYFHVLGRSLDQQGVPSEISQFQTAI